MTPNAAVNSSLRNCIACSSPYHFAVAAAAVAVAVVVAVVVVVGE